MPGHWEPEDRDDQPDIWHSGRLVEISEAGLDFVKVRKCIHCGAIAPYQTLCIPRIDKKTATEADDEDLEIGQRYPVNELCDCLDCKPPKPYLQSE